MEQRQLAGARYDRGEFLIRDDWAMLNNGSFGACPAPVFAEYQRWQRVMETHPADVMMRETEHLQAAREPLAAYLGTNADRLAFVANATLGVNFAVRAVVGALAPGDEVLTGNQEYGACSKAWQYHCRRAGVVYVEQPLPLPVASADEVTEALFAGVGPRTRVLFLSHITAPTALTLPVAQICRRAREAGLITVIDGAHVPGQRALALDEIGADFYTGNCHKWMCAPKGTAFLYATADAERLLEPLVVGHGWSQLAHSERPLHDYVERLGTRDLSPFLAVPAAIDYMASREWPQVRARCHQLLLATKRAIEHDMVDRGDMAPLCPETDEWLAQMAAIHLPADGDVAAFGRLLEEARVEMPLWTVGDMRMARLCVQSYTNQAELDLLVELAARTFG